MRLDVILSPRELAALTTMSLQDTDCVVFDILRATTSIVTALHHGAIAVLPVSDIPAAMTARTAAPDALLAGERDGLRIRRELTGSVDFDLGNSPREYTPAAVKGRRIISTTTNGTKALRACVGARTVLASAFGNLGATWDHLRTGAVLPSRLLLVCSGTGDEAAYEDVLAAGAMASLVAESGMQVDMSDAAAMALRLHEGIDGTLEEALARSVNGRRLLERPALAPDVPECARRDHKPLVVLLDKEGWLRPAPPGQGGG